jgi:hypothetical protein
MSGSRHNIATTTKNNLNFRVKNTINQTHQITSKVILLKPGQYEIVLCIDNREFYGRGYV